MTPEQRETAIREIETALAFHPRGSEHFSRAEEVLLRLQREFVVLHRDDVTEEYIDHLGYPVEPGDPADNPPAHKQLVTRWEPITKEASS